MSDAPITTEELRAAFDRAWSLRFFGWTFERACASPLMMKSMQAQARAHRHHQPDAPRQGSLAL